MAIEPPTPLIATISFTLERGDVARVSLDAVDGVLVRPHLERLAGALVEGDEPASSAKHPEDPGIGDHGRTLSRKADPGVHLDIGRRSVRFTRR